MSDRAGAAADIALAACGMVVFALFWHRGAPGLLAGGVGAISVVMVVGRSLARAPSVPRWLGIGGGATGGLAFACCGAAVGLIAGVLHRRSLGLAALPSTLSVFACVAAAIGAAEELMYRGWMQGRANVWGRVVAVLVAAGAHTAYKTALFAWGAASAGVDLVVLAGLTGAGGLVLGALREWARSVVPPLLAHVVFDVVVYGAATHAPWWVWR